MEWKAVLFRADFRPAARASAGARSIDGPRHEIDAASVTKSVTRGERFKDGLKRFLQYDTRIRRDHRIPQGQHGGIDPVEHAPRQRFSRTFPRFPCRGSGKS